MGKIIDYLKHFLMLDPPLSYSAQDYRDYDGPLFKRYKRSAYFYKNRRQRIVYLKSEVAHYSEVTKIAMLLFMGMILFIYIAFLNIFIRTILDPEFRIASLMLTLTLIGFILSRSVIGCIPRAIFLIKNFRVDK
jgi:hypothetical protein